MLMYELFRNCQPREPGGLSASSGSEVVFRVFCEVFEFWNVVGEMHVALETESTTGKTLEVNYL